MEKELYDQIYQIENVHWWYTTRQKIIFEWVKKLIANYDNPKILDVGCGTGFNIEKLRSQFADLDIVVGMDLSINALEYCRERHLPCLVCGDASDMPIMDESFDIILALDIMEHIGDDIRAINELIRLLKPKGVVIIFTPAFEFLWGLQDILSDHRRRYEITDLNNKLIQGGLTPIKITYVNMFLFPMIWIGRLILKKIGYQRLGNFSENDITPGWSNWLLGMIFSAEIPLLRKINLPIGVSIFGIYKK